MNLETDTLLVYTGTLTHCFLSANGSGGALHTTIYLCRGVDLQWVLGSIERLRCSLVQVSWFELAFSY